MAAKHPKPPAGTSALTPKELAAQARAESEAAERRRENMIRIVVGLVVLLIVAALLGVGFIAGRDSDSTNASAGPPPAPDPDAPLPAGVSTQTYGVPYGTGWDSEIEAKLPTLELWEDFQCPACAQVEALAGDSIKALADEGLVKVLFRPATFLDVSLAVPNEANGNPFSSARATGAWGCAIDAGVTAQYHAGIFEVQPADEGVGFSDDELIALGGTVGIEGEALDTFTTCVKEGTYLPWSANSNLAFAEAGVGGTPTGYLNGVPLNSADLADIEGLTAKIAAATAP